MQIRPATRTDLAAIAAIEAESFPDPWPQDWIEAYFDDDKAVILLAADSRPIAFLIARDEPSRHGRRLLHIHDLAVTPTHRRQGAATALLAELVAIARASGVRQIRLEVRVGNETARRFYQCHGFSVVRRVTRYYEDGASALRMELSLRQA